MYRTRSERVAADDDFSCVELWLEGATHRHTVDTLVFDLELAVGSIWKRATRAALEVDEVETLLALLGVSQQRCMRLLPDYCDVGIVRAGLDAAEVVIRSWALPLDERLEPFVDLREMTALAAFHGVLRALRIATAPTAPPPPPRRRAPPPASCRIIRFPGGSTR